MCNRGSGRSDRAMIRMTRPEIGPDARALSYEISNRESAHTTGQSKAWQRTPIAMAIGFVMVVPFVRARRHEKPTAANEGLAAKDARIHRDAFQKLCSSIVHP